MKESLQIFRLKDLQILWFTSKFEKFKLFDMQPIIPMPKNLILTSEWDSLGSQLNKSVIIKLGKEVHMKKYTS